MLQKQNKESPIPDLNPGFTGDMILEGADQIDKVFGKLNMNVLKVQRGSQCVENIERESGPRDVSVRETRLDLPRDVLQQNRQV